MVSWMSIFLHILRHVNNVLQLFVIFMWVMHHCSSKYVDRGGIIKYKPLWYFGLPILCLLLKIWSLSILYLSLRLLLTAMPHHHDEPSESTRQNELYNKLLSVMVFDHNIKVIDISCCHRVGYRFEEHHIAEVWKVLKGCLKLWARKVIECWEQRLKGHFSKILKGSSLRSTMDYGNLIQKISEVNIISNW